MRPSFWIIFWKRSRSSARSIESGVVPMMGAPAASSARASLSGVCPPYCTITPFGFLCWLFLCLFFLVCGLFFCWFVVLFLVVFVFGLLLFLLVLLLSLC